ncbi:Variable major outer membrane lipoprotein (plasmid) [Borrelia crocidurae DOU]|uniref:Variable major outer membrane lipoprotein n=1 Tax=Borrelia crocidurae DOU TaxID=1293575 RepID=W5SLK6_9SPIR|nr:Variable major outer membrane lipoprotein [Borrelia crocidurae DOU]
MQIAMKKQYNRRYNEKTVKNVLEKLKQEVDKARDLKVVGQQ